MRRGIKCIDLAKLRTLHRQAVFNLKSLYKLHSYIGLFVAAHFTVLAVTGLVLLLKDEVGAKSDESLRPANWSEGYIKGAAALEKSFPADRLLALYPDDADPSLLHARLGLDGAKELRGARRALVDLATGEEIKEKPHRASAFFDWALSLHRELFLGSAGKLYVGFIGFLYVFILVSGFLIYGRFMRGRSYGDIRPGRVPSSRDIHKFVGVTTFGWALVVGLSGVFLAFNGLLIKSFQKTSLAHLSARYADSRPASVAPFSEVMASVVRSAPDKVISYVSFPESEYGIAGHYLFLVNGEGGIDGKLSELLVVSQETAKLAETVELPLYMKIVMLSEPLHFGDYGGWVLKVIWAVFTLASLSVTLLGVYSFFMKRRKAETKPARAKFEHGPPYRRPLALGALIVVGLGAALAVDGMLAVVASALLLIPIYQLYASLKVTR